MISRENFFQVTKNWTPSPRLLELAHVCFRPICYRAFAVYGYFLTRIRTRTQAENIKRICELQFGCKATVSYGNTEHRASSLIYILTTKYLFLANNNSVHVSLHTNKKNWMKKLCPEGKKMHFL